MYWLNVICSKLTSCFVPNIAVAHLTFITRSDSLGFSLIPLQILPLCLEVDLDLDLDFVRDLDRSLRAAPPPTLEFLCLYPLSESLSEESTLDDELLDEEDADTWVFFLFLLSAFLFL